MNYRNIIKCLFVAGTLSVSTSSCSDWLEVDMEDSILETTLFSTNEGFLTSLNGIYSSLNQSSLYGGMLGMVGVDIMAQYYNVGSTISDHTYYYYASYNYTSSEFDKASGSLWSNMYSLIANDNLLMEKCDEPGTAIYERYYPLVKGEALALRAMMHFDLMRFYGPIYSDATASQTCLPYQETSERSVLPLLTVKEYMDKVIRDLQEAASLLQEVDPIITEGVKDGVLSDDGMDTYDWSYRQLRLNYYAVQALLARAYLWMGNKTEAYNIAKNEIIDKIETEQLNVFPWMSRTAVETTINNAKPDYVFSDEVMFSLYNMSRANLYDNYFSILVNANNRLFFVGATEDWWSSSPAKLETFYDDTNDVRRQMWSQEEGETSGDNATCLIKYQDFNVSEESADTLTYRYMTPLIRKSEIYLIAAECTDDLTEAATYINTIRNTRGAASLEVTADNKQELITKEFAREVIGEGQLFFYYKRLAMTSIISGTSGSNAYSMSLENYEVPLPTSESDLRD